MGESSSLCHCLISLNGEAETWSQFRKVFVLEYAEFETGAEGSRLGGRGR